MTTTSPDPAVATPPPEPQAPWTIDSARALYNIEGWGDGFFDINEKGHVVVRPDKDHPERSLDLFELAIDLEAQMLYPEGNFKTAKITTKSGEIVEGKENIDTSALPTI